MLDDPEALRALILRNPIPAWVGGKGPDGVSDFSFDEGGEFSTTFSLPGALRAAAWKLVEELVQRWLAEHADRGWAFEVRGVVQESRSWG